MIAQSISITKLVISLITDNLAFHQKNTEKKIGPHQLHRWVWPFQNGYQEDCADSHQ